MKLQYSYSNDLRILRLLDSNYNDIVCKFYYGILLSISNFLCSMKFKRGRLYSHYDSRWTSSKEEIFKESSNSFSINSFSTWFVKCRFCRSQITNRKLNYGIKCIIFYVFDDEFCIFPTLVAIFYVINHPCNAEKK